MNTAQTGRFLVVDDEVDLAQQIEGYLRKAGLEVAVRHDGTDAVPAVRSFDPDVLVLDLGLPGIDKIEVCRQVRALSLPGMMRSTRSSGSQWELMTM